MARENRKRGATPDLNSAVLEGTRVLNLDGKDIGTISQVHANETVVVRIGPMNGGTSIPVAMSTKEMEFLRDNAGEVYAVVDWSKSRLSEAAKFEAPDQKLNQQLAEKG